MIYAERIHMQSFSQQHSYAIIRFLGCISDQLCDKVCQRFAAGQWFSLGTPVSSTIKTERHKVTEIFLKVVFNTSDPHPNRQK